jgi:predicted permease
VIALAFAIALFAAIVSVLQAFLFRPSMVRDIDRVVRVREHIAENAGTALLNMSPRVFDAWRSAQTVFESMAAATTQSVAMRGDAGSDSLQAGMVTANFFQVLGIAPQLGRDFQPGEDVTGRDGVVVLGDATWRQRFNADPNIVGRQLRIDDQLRTVIGVMPPHLSHPYGAEIWLPLRWDELLRMPSGNFLYAPARLRAGIDVATAQASLSALAMSIHQAQPQLGQTNSAQVTSLREEILGNLRPTLWLLFACAGFVMLIATLNAATLFYAQSLSDARATVVRIALGATRGALFRRALVRSGVVVGVAVVLALFAAAQLYAPLWALSGNASIREFDSIARLDFSSLTWIVCAAALVAAALALFDVRQAFASTPSIGLGTRDATADRGMRKRLAIATTTQCSLSFILVAASLLVTLGYQRLLTMDRGFNSENLLVADLTFPLERYPTAAARDAFLGNLFQSLRAMPGVQTVGASTFTPDQLGDWAASFVIPGHAPLPDPGYELTNHRLVTPDYLSTMAIPLVAGRDFDRANPARDIASVVVSRSFAEHAWPNEDAIGQSVARLNSQKQISARLTVIGVAGDVVEASRDPDAPTTRAWYMSTEAGSNYDYAAISVVVRTAVAPTQLVAGMRQALARLDPELAWYRLAPMPVRLAESVNREQLSSFLFATFAVCALLIALGGLYGALAFMVETSRREFGVKLALGAQSRQVLGDILWRALRLAATGVALGALCALPLMKLVGTYVYGANLRDTWTLLPLAVAVLVLAALVGFIPARRAARVDPIVALRSD